MTLHKPDELSDREREILRLVATGASNKEIAHRLTISPNTVKVHLRNIFGKIEAASRTEAAMYAVKTGLLNKDQLSTITADEEEFIQQTVAENSPGLPHATQIPIHGSLTDSSSIYPTEEKEIQRARPYRRLALVGVPLLALVIIGSWWIIQNIPQKTTPTPTPTVTPTFPLQQSWVALSPLIAPRQGMAVVADNGFIYAIGGETSSGVSSSVERYDPGANKWESLAPKNLPTTDIAAGVVGGKIYVPGGRTQDGQVISQLEIYDPRSDSWTFGAPLPIPLSAYSLSTFEGKIYLFGGWNGREVIGQVYEYEPALDKWSKRTSMPTNRQYAGAAVAAGNIYVIGGINDQGALTTNEMYTPFLEGSSETPWANASPLPYARYAMGVATTGDIIHVIGGEELDDQQPTVLEYIPRIRTWKESPNPPLVPWSHLGATNIDMFLFALGGKGPDQAITAQNYKIQVFYTISIPLIP